MGEQPKAWLTPGGLRIDYRWLSTTITGIPSGVAIDLVSVYRSLGVDRVSGEYFFNPEPETAIYQAVENLTTAVAATWSIGEEIADPCAVEAINNDGKFTVEAEHHNQARDETFDVALALSTLKWSELCKI